MHKSLTKHLQVPVSRSGSRKGVRALVGALLTSGLVLSGCAQDSGNVAPSDVAGQGYQSGDGSITTWVPSERTDVVALTGQDYDAQPVDTTAWYGEIVVLNTWYAACPPCRAEAPDLVALESDFADQGVKFLGVNRTDDAGTAQAFEREYGVTWPSINDASGSAIANLAGVVPIKAVPTTVVLDREGKVAARVLGQIDKSTMKALISDTLAEGK